MKKVLLKFVFALAVPLSVSAAQAGADGTRDSGGGIGVFCSNQTPQLQILDLYEARNVNHLSPLPSKGNLNEQVFEATLRDYEVAKDPYFPVKRPNKPSDQQFEEYMRRNINFVDYELPPTGDATLPTLPAGCRFVQIAATKMSLPSVITINRTLWGMLDTQNQAALLFHEMSYWTRRAFEDERNSNNVRAYVSRLFSMKQPVPKYYDMPTKNFSRCWGASSHVNFYYYPSIDQQLMMINFISIGTSLIPSWRTVFKAGPFDILNHSDFEVQGAIESEIDAGHYDFKIFRRANSAINIIVYNRLLKTTFSDTVQCQHID